MGIRASRGKRTPKTLEARSTSLGRVPEVATPSSGASSNPSARSRGRGGAFTEGGGGLSQEAMLVWFRGRRYVRMDFKGVVYHIDPRYQLLRVLARGAYGPYGNVAYALNTRTNKKVAIKRVTRILDDHHDTRGLLREIKVLRHLKGHSNIVALEDFFLDPVEPHTTVYLVFELMQTDLLKVLQSANVLQDIHMQYATYHLLCGLKYAHSANVWHREIKPINILMNADCRMRIFNFGMCRGKGDYYQRPVTSAHYNRWHAAPELMFTEKVDERADVWSVGCVLAEMYTRRPIFRGSNLREQMTELIKVLGRQTEQDLAFIERVQKDYVERIQNAIPESKEGSLKSICLGAPEDCIDLLRRLLQFNPDLRITVDGALSHPFYRDVRRKKYERTCAENFNYAAEKGLATERDIKRELEAEADHWTHVEQYARAAEKSRKVIRRDLPKLFMLHADVLRAMVGRHRLVDEEATKKDADNENF